MTSISSLLRRLNKDLTCTICLCTFDQATSLPCQHIFCQGCVDQLLTQAKGGDACTTGKAEVAVCPLCKERFSRRSVNAALHMQEMVKTFRSMVASYEAEFCVMSQRPMQISDWNEEEEEGTVPSQKSPNSGGQGSKAELVTPPPLPHAQVANLSEDGLDVILLESPDSASFGRFPSLVVRTPCALTKRRALQLVTLDDELAGSSLCDTIPTQNTLLPCLDDETQILLTEESSQLPQSSQLPKSLQVIIPKVEQGSLDIFDSEDEPSVDTCPLPLNQPATNNDLEEIPTVVFDECVVESESPFRINTRKRVLSDQEDEKEITTAIFDEDYEEEIPTFKKRMVSDRRKIIIPASSKTQDETPGSQGSFTLRLDTSPLPEMVERKRMAISSTINADQKAKIQKFGQLKKDNILEDLSEQVTHFIVTDQDSINTMKKSASFLLALIYGCKIVKFSWVEQSILANKWLPEKDFLIEQECTSLVSTNQRKQLFEQLGFLLHASCASTSPQKNRLDLSNLIKLCGGTVLVKKDELPGYLDLNRQHSSKKLIVRTRWKLEVKALTVFMGLSSFSIDNLKAEMKRFQGSVLLIDGNWVIESILAGTLMPLAGFVRNLEGIFREVNFH